jgi:cytochrome c553
MSYPALGKGGKDLRLFWLISIFVLASCGNYSETNPPTTQSFSTLGFDAVEGMVIRPQCFRCHSAVNSPTKGSGINLEDYAVVKARMTDIISDLQDNSMPKTGPPVPDNLKQIVVAWANIGAPMTSNEPMPNGTSTKPVSIHIPVGFDQMRDKVFTPYCTRCHGFMNDYATVKKNIGKIAAAIDHDMPKDGPPLNPKLKQIIKTWVSDGMLEGSEEVRQKILEPYCTRCHGKFSDGATVSKKALDIWSAVWSDEMPRGGGPVPMELKLILDQWFKTGAAN